MIAWWVACAAPAEERPPVPAPAPTTPAPAPAPVPSPAPKPALSETIGEAAASLVLADDFGFLGPARWGAGDSVWVTTTRGGLRVEAPPEGTLTSFAQLIFPYRGSDRDAPREVDLDGDGALDLVFPLAAEGPYQVGPQVRLWRGPLAEAGVSKDAGTPLGQAEPLEATHLSVGDLDGDGIADLAVAGETDVAIYPHPLGEPAAVTRLRGSFANPRSTASDLDADGIDDLAVITDDGPTVVHFGPVTGADLEDGDQVLALATSYGDDLATADLDGDGRADLALGLYDPARVAVALGAVDAPTLASPSTVVLVAPEVVLGTAVFGSDGTSGLAILAATAWPGISARLALVAELPSGTVDLGDVATRYLTLDGDNTSAGVLAEADGALAVTAPEWAGLSADTPGAVWLLGADVWSSE